MTAPRFWERLQALYNDTISHAFIVTGNLHDWVADETIASAAHRYRPVASYLTSQLARFDVLITVHPARGIDFPIPAHRTLVIQLLNLMAVTTKTPLIAQILGDEAEFQGRNGNTPRPPVRGAPNFGEVIAFLDALLSETRYLPDRVRERDGADDAPIPARVAVLITEGELLIPPFDLGTADAGQRATLARLLDWARSPAMMGRQHLIVLLSESRSGLHPELLRASARWEPIDIPRPATEAREAFIASRLELYPELVLEPELTPQTIARLTGGLTLRDIEDAIFRGIGAELLTRRQLAERKSEVLRTEFGEVIAIEEPRFGFDAVGGYAYLKDWLRRRVVEAFRTQRPLPRNILLPGPPGTGKTQLTEALAYEAGGVPFVRWSPNRFMSKWLGESERNFERVTRAILALAPCIVFVDELDGQFRNRETTPHGSSQSDDRILSLFLSFLEDPATAAAGVLFVAATNHPEQIDSAIRSRFARVIPVLPPTDDERPEVLAVQLRRIVPDTPLDQLARWPETLALSEQTAGWTGRHLRGLIDLAQELVEDGAPPREALRACISLYKAPDLGAIGRFIATAIESVTDLTLLPPPYRQAAREPLPFTPEPEPATRRRRHLS